MQTKSHTSLTAGNDEKLVVAIELGSSRAKIGIAGFDPNDTKHTLTVYNAVTLPTVDSMRYGRVTNVREVTNVVMSLLESVEKKYPMEGRKIIGTFLSIGGLSLKSKRISARIVFPDRGEITEDLLERLQDQALDGLSTSDEFIWIEPIRFNVDNIPTPRPIGTLGTRLAGEYSAIVYNPTYREDVVNLIKERVGLDICGISVRPIALAHLVLSRQEVNGGCMLVDFGAETISISIYKNSALQYLATIPLGSRIITKDISTVMSVEEEEAERLKLSHANAMPSKDAEGEDTELQGVIDDIVLARLADVVANIVIQPEYAGFTPEQLPDGIILTGGGTNMRNFPQLLQSQSHMKVRVATLPTDIIIADSSLSATENLDLIALLNEGAEALRDKQEEECVLPEATSSVDADDPTKEEVEENVIFDFTSENSDTRILKDTKTENQRADVKTYVYEPGEFNETKKTNSDDKRYYDNLQSEEDFIYDLVDSDEAQRRKEALERKRKEREDKATRLAQEKEKREAANRAKAEARKKEREEREKRAKEKEKERDKSPTRMDRFINKLHRFLLDNGEDNSADLE